MGHAILHGALLVWIRPTTYQKYSPSQLAFGQPPNIYHFRIFGCVVYVLIAPPQCTKIGPPRRLRIYVGFDFPSIIRYLKPLTDDIFKERFEDCYFDKNIFPSLGKEKLLPEARQEITCNSLPLSHFDPHTNQCELEVQKIIHLHSIANQLPNVFIDNKKIVKSYIPTVNTPVKIEGPVGQSINTTANESNACLKCGRLIDANDKISWKRKAQGNEIDASKEALPTKLATKIDPSKFHVQKSPGNESPKEEPF